MIGKERELLTLEAKGDQVFLLGPKMVLDLMMSRSTKNPYVWISLLPLIETKLNTKRFVSVSEIHLL